MQTEPFMIVLTTAVVNSASPTHDDDSIEDKEVLSPPASTEINDTDEGDFEGLTDDEDLLHPHPLDYCEEELEFEGEAIDEYHEGGKDLDLDWAMDIDAAGGINARVTGLVSLPTIADPSVY